MIQVKLIVENDEDDLEEAVNAFLEDVDDMEVLSIQYSLSQVYVDDEVESTFSAMVIYRIDFE